METILKGRKSIVCIVPDHPTVLIGRRATSTRRKRLADESGASIIEIAKNEALAQVAAGADVVDVNINATSLEQAILLPRIVEAVQEAVEVPLSISTSNLEALAAALKVYQGKPLVNVVNGEDENLNQVLPLVAEHGAAVVGLCVDEAGIPDNPYRRLEIACKIIERAESWGIPQADILIDCQTRAVEVDHEAALTTLEAIRLIKAELGLNMTLDVSNISSELPNYTALHQTLLAVAITEGVNAPFADAAQARQTILSIDLLLGRDEHAMRYIKYYHYRRSGIRSLVDWELIG
jgi:5-methyltetrahydrofolate--homocysteine methyltransferase